MKVLITSWFSFKNRSGGNSQVIIHMEWHKKADEDHFYAIHKPLKFINGNSHKRNHSRHQIGFCVLSLRLEKQEADYKHSLSH